MGSLWLPMKFRRNFKMQYVTLVNRSKKTLEGVWDGKVYQIPPGKNSFPEIQAMKFKEQNPINGSEDPYSLTRDYLCGIEEFNDPITPAEQNDAPVMNKGTLEKIRKGELVLVKADHPYNRVVDSSAPLSAGGGAVATAFTKA